MVANDLDTTRPITISIVAKDDFGLSFELRTYIDNSELIN